jgi:hypothetical protein
MPDSSPELAAPLMESRILLLRGHKVLLDRDLAQLYQVRPIALRQQVRRNPKRMSQKRPFLRQHAEPTKIFRPFAAFARHSFLTETLGFLDTIPR